MNPRRLLIVVLSIAVLVAILPAFADLFGFSGSGVGAPPPKALTISEVVDQVRQGQVQQIRINNQSRRLVVCYKLTAQGLPNEDCKHPTHIGLAYAEPGDKTLQQYLLNQGISSDQINIEVDNGDSGGLLLTTLIPLLVLGGLFVFFLRMGRGKSADSANGKGDDKGDGKGDGKDEERPQGRSNDPLFNFGRSRARFYKSVRPSVTFADVAGIEESKQELAEVVEFLREPERFAALGARVPRGVLLVGPPGVGKTLVAKALAGEAGVPFFSISGSEFVELFAGVGASRVRDLFSQAKRNAPCIIFIDEIDAVGRARGIGPAINDEREQTLNQILVEMDGFTARTNVIIIAATNRPDVLDAALTRPGRFDRQVMIDPPDVKGREAILRVHAKGKPMATDIDLSMIARLASGFSGADLANLMNEAAILAARRNRRTISMAEMEEALDRVYAGPERKSRVVAERDRVTAAYHEVGHAITARMLPYTDPVQKLTIVPRGRAGGYTRTVHEEGYEPQYASRNQLRDMIAFAMGGHMAEEAFFGEVSSGASNDIARATEIARRMVLQYGMSKRLGPLAWGKSNGGDVPQSNYSKKMAYTIDLEIRHLLEEGKEQARTIIAENRDKLAEIAEALLLTESMGGAEFEAFFTSPRPKPQLEWPAGSIKVQPTS